MDKNEIQNLVDKMNKNDYSEYLTTWFKGIPNEIHFWCEQFTTSHEVWMKRRGYSPYVYENDFKYVQYLKGNKVDFLDVGSGPVGDCGVRLIDKPEISLSVRAVDPLAYVYRTLKHICGLKTKLNIEFSCVENLSDKFNENFFDIVHMRNSLDHSFNPLLGIMQLLYVTKSGGGVLVLNHADNEAEFTHYEGLHQWNLEVKNKKFYIWKKDMRIDIADILREYIDVECTEAKTFHSYHTVVMHKNKDIPLILDSNRGEFIEKLFEQILSFHLNNIIHIERN